MKVIIDRAKWNTGRYTDSYVNNNYLYGLRYGKSFLLNYHGMRCCLGFLGKECGFDGLNHRYPSELDQCDWPKKLFQNVSNNVMSIMDTLIIINDIDCLSDKEREDWVSEGFKAMDCEVEFTGKYPVI